MFLKKMPYVLLPRLFFYCKGQESQFIRVHVIQKTDAANMKLNMVDIDKYRYKG